MKQVVFKFQPECSIPDINGATSDRECSASKMHTPMPTLAKYVHMKGMLPQALY